MAVFYAPMLGWDRAPGWGWGIWDFDPSLGGTVPGSGAIETETRRVSNFDAISIEYPAEITVKQGRTSSVTIEADDNLLPQLGTEVEGSTLVFENIERDWRDRVNPSETVQVTITVVNLESVAFSTAGSMYIYDLETESLDVAVSGAGDIELINIDAESLAFSLSGAGNIEADGIVDDLHLRISGMGSFKGEDLETLDASVRISGAGSATIWVENELDASISGAGSVNYYGDPDVSKSISGVGSVTQVGEK
jgi:hypothetical protein